MSDRHDNPYNESIRDNRQSPHHSLCYGTQYNYCLCARHQPNVGQQYHNSYHYGHPGNIQHPQTVRPEHDRVYDAPGGAMNDQASHASVEPGSIRSGSNSRYNRQRPVVPIGEQGVRAEDGGYRAELERLFPNGMNEPVKWDLQADIGGRNKVPMDRFLSDTSDRRRLYDPSANIRPPVSDPQPQQRREIIPRDIPPNFLRQSGEFVPEHVFEPPEEELNGGYVSQPSGHRSSRYSYGHLASAPMERHPHRSGRRHHHGQQ